VWNEITRGDYIAQALVAPSERRLVVDSAETDLKLDVRAYVYGGAIQLVVVRFYEGQMTNFRTPGGGFAPVFVVGAENKNFLIQVKYPHEHQISRARRSSERCQPA
jgi:hypothetical protein